MKKLTEKLDGMLKKTFAYGGHIHCLIDYTVDNVNNKFTLITNLKEFTKTAESLPEFLEYWQPMEMTKQVDMPDAKQLELITIAENQSQADRMVTLLEQQIELVKNNKDYIPQAKAINNNVVTIVNIQKMKLDYMKAMRGK